MDGKLMLVTNLHDLSPHDIVGRFKALVDFKRGFRVLTSELEMAPIAHRIPDHAVVTQAFASWRLSSLG